MDSTELRAMQAPIKDRYKSDPNAAFITLKAKGSLESEGISCKVETGRPWLRSRVFIRQPAVPDSNFVRATCCSRHWLPVLV